MKLNDMMTIRPDAVTTARLHKLLLGAVSPRPIAFASTIDLEGRPNLAPFSFFNVFSANPPILVFSPARRVRDQTTKHSLDNVRVVAEVVINIVDYQMVHQMSLASAEFPEGVNEFEKSGLTMLPSVQVQPHRVAESPVQFECKVNEIKEFGKEGGAGSLVICEVVLMHIRESVLDGSREQIDQYKVDAVSRMGGSWYSRANQGMFEVPKPLSTIGIGVDALPKSIRSSEVLRGSDLAKLAGVDRLPSAQDIEAFRRDQQAIIVAIREKTIQEIHTFAKQFLDQDQPDLAWGVLLVNLEEYGNTR